MSKQIDEYVDKGDGRLEINPRPALAHRKAPIVQAEDGLSRLHQRLAIATVIYEKHGDGGRAGARAAIVDVVDFCRDQGIPVQALLPLFALADGLDDLDRRTVTPLLSPKKAPGKPPKSGHDARTEALLAVVMECCVRHLRDEKGQTRFLDPAAEMATRLVRGSSLQFAVTTIRMREVREAVAEEARSDLRRMLFDEVMRDAISAASIIDWVRAFVAAPWMPAPAVSAKP